MSRMGPEGESENQTNEFDPASYVERAVEGMKRETQFRAWLSGEKPFTEEESGIIANYRSSSSEIFAKRHVSIHRRSMVRSYLAGEGQRTLEEEAEFSGKFRGSNADVFKREHIRGMRRQRLSSFLKGDNIVPYLTE